MLRDMEHVGPLYRPTSFWEVGLREVTRELESRGFDDFRAHATAHQFYVPLYSRNTYLRHRGAIDWLVQTTGSRGIGRWRQSLQGRAKAQRDLAVFLAADTPSPPALAGASESAVGCPVEQFDFGGRRYSRSFLNYLRGLAFLKKHADLTGARRVLEIGGGYGTLAEILATTSDGLCVIDVDIPPVAAVASHYLREVLGDDAVLTYETCREDDTLDVDEIVSRYRAAVLCPWQLPRLRGSVDLFVNFISFQEMEPDVVANYARLVNGLEPRWVLLRNKPEGKPLLGDDGEPGVRRPTTTDAMAGMFDGFELRARDGAVFGEQRRDGRVISEVLVLGRAGPGV